METSFTPLASFSGGLLIGLAAVLLMLSLGRIFGATGILSGFLVPGSRDELSWRAALIAGMVSAPALLWLVWGKLPALQVPSPWPLLVIGGVIVGIGVTWGSGCTSGHGVCGNARLSPRSIVATLCFMATAALTVFIRRHVVGI